MQFKSLLAFFSLSQVLSLASAAPPPELKARVDGTGDEFIQEWLKLHNDERNSYNAAPLSWNGDLAYAAQQWAEQCTENPPPADSRNYGFNIGMYTKQQAFDAWKQTKSSYPGDASRPWQQIVWKSTTDLGCGEATCVLEGDMLYTMNACFYNPGYDGNYFANVEAQVRVSLLAFRSGY
uniref:Pathogenesis-related protein 1 n=1 Tax=Moniliophthora roreri TaxID=221103 RepID=A0A8E6Y9J3_MONRR|nr:pathogenesis-related protein 1 [Moniliophthora roreri]